MANRPLPDLAARLNALADAGISGVPDGELLRRFAETRDEAAFELLVWRHGSLVLGSRRLLGRAEDADDAFQAVFLALARKAGSIRRGETLPGWLHRVAVQITLRLRATIGRRNRVESHPLPEDSAAPAQSLPDDTARMLEEEIGQLPDKLRVSFILCHLHGYTHEEAAAHLGCPRGTVLSRVARARARFQTRLMRRGLTLSAGGALAANPSAVPAALIAGTVRASIAFVAGHPDAVVSSQAATLAQGVLRSMTISAMKPFIAILIAAVLTVGAVLAAYDPRETDSPSNPPQSAARFIGATIPPPNYKLATVDHKSNFIGDVRFSPDGKWIITVGRSSNDALGSTVAAWERASGKHVRILTETVGRERDRANALFEVEPAIRFSPEGRLCAVVDPGSDSVGLWSVGDWKRFATLPHRYASNAQFSADGKRMVTWSWVLGVKEKEKDLSELKVWKSATGKLAFELESKPKEIFTWATFSPDGRTLAVGTSTGAVRLLDSETGKLKSEIQTPHKHHIKARFSPDGTKLYSWTTTTHFNHGGLGMRVVRQWDLAAGNKMHEFEGEVEPSRSPFIGDNARLCALSADGKRVVAVDSGHGIWVWDAATRKKVVICRLAEEDGSGILPFGVINVSITPDGSMLAVSGRNNRSGKLPSYVSVLNALPSGKELVRLPSAKSLVIADDGKTVAVVMASEPSPAKEKPDEVIIRSLADLLQSHRSKGK